MIVTETAIPDVKVITPRILEDDRGYFFESWNARELREKGIGETFVQDNQSCSTKHVLRGLHYQVKNPQGKLVRVVTGRIFDVAVDLRTESPSFGKWVGVELSADNKKMLWVPEGFAHGFVALEDKTTLLYKCTDYYAHEHERSLLWSDPALGIDWPLGGNLPILSRKDAEAPTLQTAECY